MALSQLSVLSVPQFLGPLQSLWSWATQPQATAAPRLPIRSLRAAQASHRTAASPRPPHLAQRRVAQPVVRVVHGRAGRMVISGRLADVCAELDRLAAREAQRR